MPSRDRSRARLAGLVVFGSVAAVAVVSYVRSLPPSPDSWQATFGSVDLKRAAALYETARVLPGEDEPVSCAVCHGKEGQGNYGIDNPKHVAPHLAGLNAVYVGEQLRAYASGKRLFPLMHVMALPLSAQQIADLSVYVHGLRGGGAIGLPPADEAVLVRGKAIWVSGVPGRAAACASCHGIRGTGDVMRSPEIAGEPRSYLIAQLQTMHDRGRTGTTAAWVMTEQAHKLTATEMSDAASYVASLPPASLIRPRSVMQK